MGGLHPIVDLNAMQVLDIEDTPSPAGQPPVMGEYVPALIGMPLREVKPSEITQPKGVSFTLTGNLLRWQNWELRLGFNHREGLVLHMVGFRDNGRLRSVAHRMSFAEMVVPYRDPSVDHYRRTAFDIGEWGLGFMTQSLELGCDCLGEITYVDAVLHDTTGEPRVIKNAICIHEEDNAVLWKHVDHKHGAEVRRMRRLVVSFHVTVANYEYLVYWRFYQDGNIECEVRATGIMVTTSFAEGKPSPNGATVDQRTYAPITSISSSPGSTSTSTARTTTPCIVPSFYAPPVGAENPHGLALEIRNTPLRTEHEGKQDRPCSVRRYRARGCSGRRPRVSKAPESTISFNSVMSSGPNVRGRESPILMPVQPLSLWLAVTIATHATSSANWA